MGFLQFTFLVSREFLSLFPSVPSPDLFETKSISLRYWCSFAFSSIKANSRWSQCGNFTMETILRSTTLWIIPWIHFPQLSFCELAVKSYCLPLQFDFNDCVTFCECHWFFSRNSHKTKTLSMQAHRLQTALVPNTCANTNKVNGLAD